MANAIGARRDGDDFQARLFWLKAAHLLDDEGPIQRVGFECGPRGFDDLWVEYDPSHRPKDQYGVPLAKEFFQCKWHVSPGLYTHKDLTEPQFINASTKSLLQRAYAALLDHSTADECALRLKFVTNWRLDPNDRLSSLIRSRSHTLKVDELFEGTTARSATAQIRKLWREHLQLDEIELRRLAAALGFSYFGESLDDMRERLDVTCRAFGLRRVPAESSAVLYDDIVRQWAAQGRNVFDRKLFRKACVQDGLFEGKGNRSVAFGIKSFEHPIDRLEDRCTEVLDLVAEFDNRFIREGATWNATLLPTLQTFLLRAARSHDRIRLAIDAHTTLAFATGAVLNRKSGRVLEIEQRTPSRRLWSPDDESDVIRPSWEVAEYEFASAGADMAIAVSLTHDVEPKVRAYLSALPLPPRTLLTFKPVGGASSSAVASGHHAYQLAEALARRVKAQRESQPETQSRVHLFVAAPNGFTLYLGQHCPLLAPLTLYEFDFEGARDGSYRPSLALP